MNKWPKVWHLNLKMKVSRVVQAPFCMKSLVATVLRLSSGEITTVIFAYPVSADIIVSPASHNLFDE